MIAILLLVTLQSAAHECDNSPDECVVLVWLPYWDQARAFKSYQANRDIISHVSFFWFYIDNIGDIKTYRYAKPNRDMIAKVQQNGDKAYAIVANLPDLNPDHPEGNWNRDIVHQMLSSTETMDHHINHLVELAVEYNFDGINIDYENLRRADREDYTNFIARLSVALKQQQKELVIALHPKTAEFNPREDNGSHAQDWRALQEHVDQMHIMAYGEHYIGSKPGSIASADWLEDILDYLMQQNLDNSKFVIGLPLYSQLWKLKEDTVVKGIDKDMTFSDIIRLKTTYNGNSSYQSDTHSNRLKYTNTDGHPYVAYFENQQSIRAKLDIVRHRGLSNIAFWRIGGEDPGVWDAVKGH